MSEEHKLLHLEDQPAHHPSGPSSLALQELCPSFDKGDTDDDDQRGDYSDPEGDAAWEGRCLHIILETGVVPDGFTFTDDHAELIRNTKEMRDAIVEGASEVHNEVRLDIGRTPDGSHLTFGTTDVLALYPDLEHAEVIDFKMGLLEIEDPKTNIQGWAYCLGVFEKYPWVQTCTMSFIVPRQLDEPIYHTFSRNDMDLMHTRIRTIIKRREEGFITPHPSACRYCAKAARCQPLWNELQPLASKWALEADMFEDAKKMDITNLEVLIQRDPKKVGLALRTLDVLAKLRTEVRDFTKEQILRGHDIPGYDVYTKRRPVRNEFVRDRDVLTILLTEFGVDPIDLFLRLGPLRRKACEDAIRETQPRGSKTEAVNAFRKRIQELNLWYDPATEPEGLSYVLRAKKGYRYTGIGLPVRDRKKLSEKRGPMKRVRQLADETALTPVSSPKKNQQKQKVQRAEKL